MGIVKGIVKGIVMGIVKEVVKEEDTVRKARQCDTREFLRSHSHSPSTSSLRVYYNMYRKPVQQLCHFKLLIHFSAYLSLAI